MDIFSQCKKINVIDFATKHLALESGALPGRFNRPWSPGSDSGGLAINETGWYDHVDKRGGDLVGLVSLVEFGDDDFLTMGKAARLICERSGIDVVDEPEAPSASTRKFNVIARYTYKNLTGEPVVRTVKTDGEPRFYHQYLDPHGKWKKGAGSIKLPYRAPDWAGSEAVWICEGEKDADTAARIGLPSTSLLDGAGNWQDEYLPYFAGKSVILVPDNDNAGIAGAKKIAAILTSENIEVRIVNVGDDGDDITDWIECQEAFGDDAYSALQALAASARPEGQVSALELAKISNATPFSNYEIEEGANGKEITIAVPLQSLIKQVHRRLLGFPASSGGVLFDYDRDTSRIHRMYNHPALFAWMGCKMQQTIDWASTRGMVSKGELFEGLRLQAKGYAATSPAPHYPTRSDIFYFHRDLPPPTHDSRYFNQFCEAFAPSTPLDAILIKVFVASCLFWRKGVHRPMWVIDSDCGQGVGKTTLATTVACLIGGYSDDHQSPITIQPSEFKGDIAEVKKQLVTQEAACRRILLIDNVVHDLNCEHLASMATATTIMGRPPYSKEMLSRLNDLTFVITTNSGTVSRDIATRSYHLKLTRPEDYSGWGDRMTKFLDEYRFQILADCIRAMQQPTGFAGQMQTRHQAWEQEVLMPIAADEDAYNAIVKENMARQAKADSEEDEAQELRDKLMSGLRMIDFEIPQQFCFITNAALVAIIDGGKRNVTLRKLRTASLTGMIAELSHDWAGGRWPRRGGRRGMAWNLIKKEPGVDPVMIHVDGAGKLEKIGVAELEF